MPFLLHAKGLFRNSIAYYFELYSAAEKKHVLNNKLGSDL